ncbi:hypothetical protein JHW43_005137 [Diplocarpon mali]|nr:hypothetical protein JHW43_005137 [Diplocarpon mali]
MQLSHILLLALAQAVRGQQPSYEKHCSAFGEPLPADMGCLEGANAFCCRDNELGEVKVKRNDCRWPERSGDLGAPICGDGNTYCLEEDWTAGPRWWQARHTRYVNPHSSQLTFPPRRVEECFSPGCAWVWNRGDGQLTIALAVLALSINTILFQPTRLADAGCNSTRRDCRMAANPDPTTRVIVEQRHVHL